jgi:hypothetical protein
MKSRKHELLKQDEAAKAQASSEQQPQTVDLLRKTAQTTARSVALGEETTEKLQVQSEQIERSKRSLDQAEYNLKVSDRLVRGIGSVGGAIASWFSRKPKVPKEKDTTAPQPQAKQKGGAPGSGGPYQPEGRQQQGPADHMFSEEENHLIDTIGRDVATLRQQAETQQTIVTHQREVLGKMEKQTDKIEGQMKKTTNKMQKICREY